MFLPQIHSATCVCYELSRRDFQRLATDDLLGVMRALSQERLETRSNTVARALTPAQLWDRALSQTIHIPALANATPNPSAAVLITSTKQNSIREAPTEMEFLTQTGTGFGVT